MSKITSLINNLKQELHIINQATIKTHLSKEITKETAILQYKKIQLSKNGKSIEEINEKLNNLDKTLIVNPPSINIKLDENLIKNHDNSKINDKHLSNIIKFLNSQRTYNELIERYNPGLRGVDQQDHVRQTANRVGLSIPE